MTYRSFRLTSRRARRISAASLTLVYFWAFVALGLTHTHGAVAIASRRALPHPPLAQPPMPAAALSPTRRLVVAPSSLAPTLILQASRSRAPPTGLV